jgi:hypothetical protein
VKPSTVCPEPGCPHLTPCAIHSTRVAAIVGKAGVGKSRLVADLQQILGWDALSIDIERRDGGGWDTLTAKVARLTAPTLVESVMIPPRYRAILRRQDAVVVLITCEEIERVRRLASRGETRPAQREYDYADVAVTVDTTDGLSHAETVAAQIS